MDIIWSFLRDIFNSMFSFLLELFKPKFSKKMHDKRNRKNEKRVAEVPIAGEWKSVFQEEQRIKSEKVILKQDGREITGTMEVDNRSYTFKGTFKNQVLIGTYESVRYYERGSIVLRYICEGLLSGYCTFVCNNNQVYNSSYVLLDSSHHDLNNGTFNFCNKCINKQGCCCNHPHIDMPTLLNNEAQSISRKTKRKIEKFANKITDNVYQMRRMTNNESEGCIFYYNNECSIYEDRPIDCRLFPFDFKEIDGIYWLIYYTDFCHLPDENEIKKCAHSIRPYLDILLPYLSEASNSIFTERLSEYSFNKLYTIDQIRDDKLS